MATVGICFIVLVVIIVLLLSAPERRAARDIRNSSVRLLLGKGTVDGEPCGLDSAASYVFFPISSDGGLGNLVHFLSKDPGRSQFPKAADRRRAKRYLPEEAGEQLASYAEEAAAYGAPEWASDYVAGVRYLFEEAQNEILEITGVPQEITEIFDVPETAGISAEDMVADAIVRFTTDWIPPGKTASTYSPDRGLVKEELVGNRRFGKRMEAVDNSWRCLLASLYNLSMNPHWRVAVKYHPRLQVELEELTILAMAADIHRRESDLMVRVPSSAGVGAGIIWISEFSYYKNIPEVTGNTADKIPTVFFAKVNLGYTFRDSRTQTWLNRRKDWLTDYMSAFFSKTTSEDFSPVGQAAQDLADWNIARLKAEGIHGINVMIASSLPFGVKKVYGIREMALVRVNLIANP